MGNDKLIGFLLLVIGGFLLFNFIANPIAQDYMNEIEREPNIIKLYEGIAYYDYKTNTYYDSSGLGYSMAENPLLKNDFIKFRNSKYDVIYCQYHSSINCEVR